METDRLASPTGAPHDTAPLPDSTDIAAVDATININWRERGGSDDNGDQGFGTELVRATLGGPGSTIQQARRNGERFVTICLARDQLAL